MKIVDSSGPDAPIDAPAIDAPPDAPPPFTGTLAIIETNLLNPGNSGTSFGQGVRLVTSFSAPTDPAPIYEENPGSPIGCRVYEYTPAQLVMLLRDEGSVQWTSYPACTFFANAGYECPHTATAGTGGVVGLGPASGTATLTDLNVTYDAANTTNRYVRITGATNAANNGLFPIVGLSGANTIVYGNPASVLETLPNTSTHVNLAGKGPTPGVADPGFLTDDAMPAVTVTMGGGGHIATFTSTFTGTVGDDFTLDVAELNKLNAIPTDGNAFTISCPSCANALVSRLDITTTDSSTAGLSPFAMPFPTTKQVRISCTGLGTSVIVPAAASVHLMSANATRIETAFARLQLGAGAPATVNVAGGHSIVGYSNP